MLRLIQPTPADIAGIIAANQNLPAAAPAMLTLASGPTGNRPRGFVHDISHSELGRGLSVFQAARTALQHWAPFDLGWVSVADSALPIQTGRLVAVIAQTAGLWSVNLSRILETLDTPTLCGFLYATTTRHLEEGQERFLLQLNPETKQVTYTIEALSQPRHRLARVAYPFTRAMQHRFARDSHWRMATTVKAGGRPPEEPPSRILIN